MSEYILTPTIPIVGASKEVVDSPTAFTLGQKLREIVEINMSTDVTTNPSGAQTIRRAISETASKIFQEAPRANLGQILHDMFLGMSQGELDTVIQTQLDNMLQDLEAGKGVDADGVLGSAAQVFAEQHGVSLEAGMENVEDMFRLLTEEPDDPGDTLGGEADDSPDSEMDPSDPPEGPYDDEENPDDKKDDVIIDWGEGDTPEGSPNNNIGDPDTRKTGEAEVIDWGDDKPDRERKATISVPTVTPDRKGRFGGTLSGSGKILFSHVKMAVGIAVAIAIIAGSGYAIIKGGQKNIEQASAARVENDPNLKALYIDPFTFEDGTRLDAPFESPSWQALVENEWQEAKTLRKESAFRTRKNPSTGEEETIPVYNSELVERYVYSIGRNSVQTTAENEPTGYPTASQIVSAIELDHVFHDGSDDEETYETNKQAFLSAIRDEEEREAFRQVFETILKSYPYVDITDKGGTLVVEISETPDSNAWRQEFQNAQMRLWEILQRSNREINTPTTESKKVPISGGLVLVAEYIGKDGQARSVYAQRPELDENGVPQLDPETIGKIKDRARGRKASFI